MPTFSPSKISADTLEQSGDQVIIDNVNDQKMNNLKNAILKDTFNFNVDDLDLN